MYRKGKDKFMKNKANLIFGIVIAVVLVAATGAILFKKFAPSFTQRTMEEQYKDMAKEEVLICLDGFPMEEKGKIIGDAMYMPLDVVIDRMNQRFYWDSKEQILSFVSPVRGLVTVSANTTSYTVGKENREMENQILYVDGDTIYISVAFYDEMVQEKSTLKWASKGEAPNRILLNTDYESTHMEAKLSEKTRLRVGPNKKYDYLLELEKDQKVIVDRDTPAENEYQKVLTTDGIEGYVPTEILSEKTETTWKRQKEEETFSQKGIGTTVCLGWHQMTQNVGAQELESKVAVAGSLNVVSPTWFALNDNKGNFSSLANEEYVTAAHAKGLKVWGLINDFDKKISLKKILGRTSIRSRLVNNIVSTAMRYKLDGINIDFEKITKETAPAYLEFLRELTLVCHANEITVTVDDYLPTDGTSCYDWKEQGKVVDYVIFMAYDEHYAGSEESGSVSSLPFVENGVDKGLQYIPAEKTVVALPFYTRLWREVKDGENVKVTSSAYGMSSAESVLQSNGAAPKWDDETSQYYAEFKADGSKYRIWLEEETSLSKKLETVMAKNVAGVAFWKLGFERMVTWSTIEKYVK